MRLSSRRRGQTVLRRCPEGAPKVEKAHGRRTNVGQKAEPADQFRLPRCGLCVMKLCAPGPSSARGSCQNLSDGVSPNTEGGQTADGRWNGPINFGHLIGDLLDMRTYTSSPPPDSTLTVGGWTPAPSQWKGTSLTCRGRFDAGRERS